MLKSNDSRSRVVKVLVWIPLRPGASWRGEGIAQTLENILIHTQGGIEYTIFCSKENAFQLASSLRESGKALGHIKICSMSFFRSSKVKKKAEQKSDLLPIPSRGGSVILSYFLRKLRGIFAKISIPLWVFNLFIHSTFQRFSLKYRNFDATWFPAPFIPFSSLLKGRKVVSFWDPFVLQYTRFSNAWIVCNLLFSILHRADRVITQSQNNLDYLVQVMGIAQEKISVSYNGSPNYEAYIKASNISHPDQLIPYLKKMKQDKKVSDFINYSVLDRLFSKLTEKTRIIMISTQYRLYKGFEGLFEVMNYLVKNYSDEYDFQFIVTAGELPEFLYKEYHWSNEKIHNISRVDSVFHAHLYRFSHLLLHPSYAEGGLGSYPQYEAASVGCASLNNNGRHMRELASYFDEDLSKIVSDFFRTEETAKRIVEILSNVHQRESNIALTNKLRFEWSDSSKVYDEIFLGVGSNNVA